MNFVSTKKLAPVFAFALIAGFAANLSAAPFPQTRVLSGKYLMGSSSLAEYDYYLATYPDYLANYAFTFYSNGTVEIYDEAGGVEYGTYVRFGGNKRITVTLTSAISPYGPVTHEIYRVGNTANWWGEVRIDGDVWGHFRGNLK